MLIFIFRGNFGFIIYFWIFNMSNILFIFDVGNKVFFVFSNNKIFIENVIFYRFKVVL